MQQMFVQFGIGTVEVVVFVVSKIGVGFVGGELTAQRVDGIGLEHLLADHDAEEVIDQFEVKGSAKGALFEAFVEFGMVTEFHDEVVEAWCIVWLDIIFEFVGQGKIPVVQFLLYLEGVVELDFVEFFEKHVVGHEMGEELIDLVVVSQLLAAVEEVGGDDGIDELSIMAILVEGDALCSKFLSERVVVEVGKHFLDMVVECLLTCTRF